MKKFVINSVTINKSDKDIETGIKREFSEGFNLICGNNEAGKSSLMNFIKYALFGEKGIDTGIIEFSVHEESAKTEYIANIKDHTNRQKRIELTDKSGNPRDYSVISDNINRRYFEQGFAITLDDLMNIQNKDTATLIDTIKDPTGTLLNDFTDKLKNKVKKILTDRNKPASEVDKILKEIKSVNEKINLQLNNESKYNDAVNEIKTAEEKLQIITRKEELLKIISSLNEERQILSEIDERKTVIETGFNEKFFENKRCLNDIIKNAGIFESNSLQIDKIKEDLLQISLKTTKAFDKIKTEYGFMPEPDFIGNFKPENAGTAEVRSLLNEKKETEKSIEIIDSELKAEEEILEKLFCAQKTLKDDIIPEKEYVKLKTLLDDLKTGTEQYLIISSELNKINSKTEPVFAAAKSVLITFVILALISAISAGASIYFGNKYTAALFAVVLIISLTGIILSARKTESSQITEEKEKLIKLKQSVIDNLILKVEKNYCNIENHEITYLSAKFNDIKNEINNKLQNSDGISKILKDKIRETEESEKHIAKNKENKQQLRQKIDEISEKTESIINKNGFDKSYPIENYPETISLICEIQNLSYQKDSLESEIKDKLSQNAEIKENLNEFITENNINISYSEDFNKNIAQLKEFDEKNIETKRIIDELNVKRNICENKIKDFEKKIEEYKNKSITCDMLPELEAAELKAEKESILKTKEEARLIKRELEEFEGLNELKIQKERLLGVYKKKIEEVIKYKMIIALTEKAKNNFNKIQPCLTEAEKYLSVLTNGKYTHINLNSEEITNKEKTKIKKWQELSRGTKEQLYFALRLGYAANYSKDTFTGEVKDTPALPLIIDDALVNFDEERTENALKCLIEFSKSNPVLFFTCKETEIKSVLNKLGCEVNLIKL